MQPVEIRIPGSFYDSQIYSGELYLWTTNGEILRVDWDRLVDSVEIHGKYSAILEFAFRRSEYLYDPNVAILLHDPEIRSILQRRFRALSETPIEISATLLEDCTKAKYSNRFGFPHADSGFYNGNLFVGGPEGVEYSWPHEDEQEIKPKKLTDLPALGIALGSSRLAVAAGDEGAYQVTAYPAVESNLTKVMPGYTNWVRWMETGLFASDRTATGTFVDFKPGKKRDKPSDRPPDKVVRQVLSIEDLHKPSETVDYVWGAEDRLCIVGLRHVDVVKFYPRRKLAQRFEFLDSFEISSGRPQQLISADNAVFGFVLEHELGLEILTSSSESISLDGEPVNWRVFPRSKYYTNHLHVIREQYLSVLSFNDDFFVNQATKIMGVEFKRSLGFGKRQGSNRPEPLHLAPPSDDELNEI